MMLHDKILPQQFLLDMKTDCLDMYASYNFHHNQQKQRLPSPPRDGEVLDLSRRCDSVETRKTPSPYNSTSSFGTVSPSTHCGSPPTSVQIVTSVPESKTTVPDVATKLICTQNPSAPLHQGIASLYPLYYQNVKQETVSPPPAPVAPLMPIPISLFPQSSIEILQKTLNRTTHNSPPPLTANVTNMLYPNILNVATTGTINSSKATRPFNAYPRDPNMVAAHFVASDHSCKPKDRTTEDYRTFRKRALGDLQDPNGGYRIVTNPKMRRNNTRNGQISECEERALESSDNDSSNGNGVEQCNKNDNNNNNDCLDTSFSGGVKDEAYYERRRKNNAAAKKSRDRRRIKEDEIAIRAAYLERQNIELLCQIDSLKKQLDIFTKV